MNDRQAVVYRMLRTLYPDSPVLSETVACSMERQIDGIMRGYEVAHAYNAKGKPYLHWVQAIGRRVRVYHWGHHAVRAGVITHLQQDREGDTWAIFGDGTGIRLQEDLRWEEVGREGAQA